jgi:hypothetical protein
MGRGSSTLWTRDGSLWATGPVAEGIEDEDEVFDPIDGCTEENVGWMRLAASTAVEVEFYVSVFDYPGGGWYVAYKRPPETVMW